MLVYVLLSALFIATPIQVQQKYDYCKKIDFKADYCKGMKKLDDLGNRKR